MLKDLARRLFFRRSTAYFLITFLYACAQIILRTALFVTDNEGARHTRALAMNATQGLYSITSTGGFENRTDVPGNMSVYSLEQIQDSNDTQQFCTMFAAYSTNLFRDNRIEDSVFIAIHIYLVIVSLYAIAKESIPHLIFIFSARFLSAVWALGRTIETFLVQKTLDGLIRAADCEHQFFGLSFFGPSFYIHRHTFEGILLGISVLSVISEAIVASKLGRIYSERPWRVVQVSSEMRKMYRLILGFSVIAQITGLILPVTMALWIDQLLNTYFAEIVGNHKYIYEAIFVFITTLLPIWITLGWFALRREWKRATLVFRGLGVILLCSWIVPWGSAMFRWAFTTWWFFGTFYCVSLVLLIVAFVLAGICRRNFGNNLDHYLMVQSRLSAMDFTHAHFEKDEKLDGGHVPDVYFSDSEYDGKSDFEDVSLGSMIEKQFEYDS